MEERWGMRFTEKYLLGAKEEHQRNFIFKYLLYASYDTPEEKHVKTQKIPTGQLAVWLERLTPDQEDMTHESQCPARQHLALTEVEDP